MKSKIKEIEDWRNQSFQEVKVWRSQRFEVWRLNPSLRLK
jgi:hypothetical protein